MIQTWKARHIITGMLTYVPFLNALRRSRESTGGSESARYCYSVWLRHLITLDRYGFRINGANVGELGPGDSLGIGLAALLSGAARYIGLDIVPYSATTGLETMFDDLHALYAAQEHVPDGEEFPRVLPRMDSYQFPTHLIDWQNFPTRSEEIRKHLGTDLARNPILGYRVPWTSLPSVAEASLDLIFSQAVLEHVDSLEPTYRAMFAWLKPGGYASHVIDFRSHGRSPFWNGHWAYSDWEWKLVRGKREYLLNREPVSTHLTCAKNVGFEILFSMRDQMPQGIQTAALSPRFRRMNLVDTETSGVMLILKKPGTLPTT